MMRSRDARRPLPDGPSAVAGQPMPPSTDDLRPVARDNIGTRVRAWLRDALLEGRFRPGERLKVRELALRMGVSETPVREALMQLVSAGAIEMVEGRAITVVRLTPARHAELRRIRLELEGLAAETAAAVAGPAAVAELLLLHERVAAAEQAGDRPATVRANAEFHLALCRLAGLAELAEILERLWLRCGPTAATLAPPAVRSPHPHLRLVAALTMRDGAAARRAVEDDLLAHEPPAG